MTEEKELQTKEIMQILADNLTLESKWFLWALTEQKEALAKEELRDIANNGYQEFEKASGRTNSKPLITSRHGLDIHTARLEGAGLVRVQEKGRVRLYYLTELAKHLLRFLAK